MKEQIAWRQSPKKKAHRDVGKFCRACSRPHSESACGYPLSGYQPIPLASVSPRDPVQEVLAR